MGGTAHEGLEAGGAQAPQLVDDARVGDLVSPLVSGDGAANLSQHWVPMFQSVAGGGAVTHLGGPLLRRSTCRV